MNMKIIVTLAALIIAANVWAIAPALNNEYDNRDNIDDLDDEIVYQASDKAKVIKAANESLKRMKGIKS